jgi:hypothetical protein
MALDLILNNSDEFENLISSQDKRVSEALVGVILKNLKSKKKTFVCFKCNDLRRRKYL